MFLNEAKQMLRTCYVFAVTRTPKKIFTSSNFSENVNIYVQVLSSMHSNKQLFSFLPLSCVAVLLAKGSYCLDHEMRMTPIILEVLFV